MGILSKRSSAPREGEVGTTIGPEANFHGVITVRGSLFVEGTVEGNIHEAQTVVVGRNGRVKGDVCAETVVVGGSIEGDVVATQQLEINSGGRVIGDIRTGKLLIEEGAVFEGACVMSDVVESPDAQRRRQAKGQEPAEAGKSRGEAPGKARGEASGKVQEEEEGESLHS